MVFPFVDRISEGIPGRSPIPDLQALSDLGAESQAQELQAAEKIKGTPSETPKKTPGNMVIFMFSQGDSSREFGQRYVLLGCFQNIFRVHGILDRACFSHQHMLGYNVIHDTWIYMMVYVLFEVLLPLILGILRILITHWPTIMLQIFQYSKSAVSNMILLIETISWGKPWTIMVNHGKPHGGGQAHVVQLRIFSMKSGDMDMIWYDATSHQNWGNFWVRKKWAAFCTTMPSVSILDTINQVNGDEMGRSSRKN